MQPNIKRSAVALALSVVAVATSNAQTGQQKGQQDGATARTPFGEPIRANTKQAAALWGEPIRLERTDQAGSEPEKQSASVAASAASNEQRTPAEGKPGDGGKWVLAQGMPVHSQIAGWATAAGWHLDWKLNRSWLVPATTHFTGSFDQAVEQVILALAAEGKPVELTIWEGNKVAEIIETSPR